MSGTPLSTVPGTSILSPWTAQQLAADAKAGQAVRQLGQKYRQIIASGSFVPIVGQPTVVNIPVQNVGLISKFFIEVTTAVTNPAGGSLLTRSSLAPWTQLSNITYTDPNQNQRVNTPGWHIALMMALRHRRVPGAALTTDTPSGFGSVIQPMAAPSTIAADAGAGTVRAIYELPLAYARNTFKGAVFAGAVFATQSLQFTFNPSFAQVGTDPISAVYTGSGVAPNAPTLATTYTVWQEYWDGFPLSLLAAMSPSLSTIYELKTTVLNQLSVGLDNYYRFANLRQFMSTILAFDNGGVMNAGSDINYFKLQSANQTVEWQYDAFLQSYFTRQAFGDDFPAGVYPFDFRADPIITAAEGNTVLSINPSLVNANAVVYVAIEDLATSSVLASAPSLAGQAGSP
jgi:hypothetical protein